MTPEELAELSEKIAKMSYEEKEARLDAILERLDNSQTPMDDLASEAKEAAQLIMSMRSTLQGAKQEITSVFEELNKQKQTVGPGATPEPFSSDGEEPY
jgi:exodeoxyribonuclease VII small subunit